MFNFQFGWRKVVDGHLDPNYRGLYSSKDLIYLDTQPERPKWNILTRTLPKFMTNANIPIVLVHYTRPSDSFPYEDHWMFIAWTDEKRRLHGPRYTMWPMMEPDSSTSWILLRSYDNVHVRHPPLGAGAILGGVVVGFVPYRQLGKWEKFIKSVKVRHQADNWDSRCWAMEVLDKTHADNPQWLTQRLREPEGEVDYETIVADLEEAIEVTKDSNVRPFVLFADPMKSSRMYCWQNKQLEMGNRHDPYTSRGPPPPPKMRRLRRSELNRRRAVQIRREEDNYMSAEMYALWAS
ncbi:hypothetical protein FA95DRAFT_1605396 [Auriscalpium vulgare]|uniref:Uncharacterized protein n=1 Tax=Auriscalpium vulgare TaxID=40419 RepID=A0ACB8RWN1_9AGAM|nr:hypothetical protein FA95DRAFT_1605396 [Auriscalpium vulgare]